VEGRRAEGEGRSEDAGDLYKKPAWAASQNGFEACVAAHYLVRQQGSGQ
jgi:hypothetical protein